MYLCVFHIKGVVQFRFKILKKNLRIRLGHGLFPTTAIRVFQKFGNAEMILENSKAFSVIFILRRHKRQADENEYRQSNFESIVSD